MVGTVTMATTAPVSARRAARVFVRASAFAASITPVVSVTGPSRSGNSCAAATAAPIVSTANPMTTRFPIITVSILLMNPLTH
jgi:hypothetical protein